MPSLPETLLKCHSWGLQQIPIDWEYEPVAYRKFVESKVFCDRIHVLLALSIAGLLDHCWLHLTYIAAIHIACTEAK